MSRHTFVWMAAPVLTAALITEGVQEFVRLRHREPRAVVVHPTKVAAAQGLTTLPVGANGGCLASEFWLEE